MDATQEFARWQKNATDDADLAEELKGLSPSKNRAEIEERFGGELAFGTGGLRGIMGAGTARMNIYTVRKATQRLANWLLNKHRSPSVAIAYDSRKKSDLFASETARVLAANGVYVWVYPRLMPTPALSFAVRYLGCDAGVCITASHNPAQYNGYKVYGADGCQITDETARGIERAIGTVDPFTDVPLDDFKQHRGHVRVIGEDVVEAYLDAVMACALPPAEEVPFRVVYTPLNGTGRECVTRILDRTGVTDLLLVSEQAYPDGDFPTCPIPNPEECIALERAMALGVQSGADIVLGTDPDCDRVGVAVWDGDGFWQLSGNEIGVLLFEYVCRRRIDLDLVPNMPIAVKTVVTTDMARHVADSYGVELREVLTGFKYIGEQIGMLEDQYEENRFIFGFEESCGYLPGSYVRDKDAVAACMLICQMAQDHKKRGKTLYGALVDLYRRFGYYSNTLHSFTYPGVDGRAKMERMLRSLRDAPPTMLADVPVIYEQDYLNPVAGRPDLPPADMLEYTMRDASRIIVRPSGTEPKIKIYIEVPSDSQARAEARAAQLASTMEILLGIAGTGGEPPPTENTEKDKWASTHCIPHSRTMSGAAPTL